MATGVLIVGVDRATRLLGHLARTDKTYTATIRLGQETVTDDAEGEVTATQTTHGVSDQLIRDAVVALTGPLQQVPSAVSAIKVNGQRAYARVRAGETVELAARPITVTEFLVHELRRGGAPGLEHVDLDVTVSCSTGTYIRALARDLGQALGVGGHLTALRRTRVGDFELTEARTMESLTEEFAMVPLGPAIARSFPRIDVSREDATLISYGGRINTELINTELNAGPYGVFDPEGQPLALMEPQDGQLRPLVVFVDPASDTVGRDD